MKFKNTAPKSLVYIDDAKVVQLTAVTSQDYVYSVSFQTDLNEAAKRNNAFTGKVYFSKIKKQQTQPVFSKDRNGEGSKSSTQPPKTRDLNGNESTTIGTNVFISNQFLIDQLRQGSTTKKETINRNDSNILKTLNFSLFDFASREDIEKAKMNTFSATERVIESVTVETLRNSPVFEQMPQTAVAPISSIAATREFRNALSSGIDPASLVQKTRGINPANRSTGGVTSRISAVQNTIQESITSNVANTVGINADASSFVSRFATVETNKIKVTLEFKVEKSLLNGASLFYFEIEMLDDSNRPVFNQSITVNHSKNLDFYFVPRQAPRINSFYRRGSDKKVVLFVRQLDQRSSFIYLYYKEILNEDYSTPYAYLGKIPVKSEDGEKKVEISKNLSKKTIIRAFSASEEERRGLLFDSVVIPETLISTENFPLLNQSDCIWDYKLGNDSTVVINGTIISNNAVSVKITRRLAEDENDDEIVMYGPSYLDGSTQFSFKDTQTQTDKTYKYIAYVILRDGIQQKCLNDLDVLIKEIKSNVITTRINNPQNLISGTNLNVVFTLTSTLNKENTALVMQNFKAQGYYDLFKDAFEKTDAELSYAYKVIRKNQTTGEEEDFGILQTPEFNDQVLRVNKNIKPLQAGYSYTYYVSSFLRSSDTLLPQLVLSGSYRGQTYTYTPYFSRNPFVLKTGTMVTETSLKEQHANSIYSFGPSGAIIEHSADFSKVLPSITNVLATNLTKTENILQWKVEGNLDKIDHFIIVLQQLTARSIVGKVHNISETNSFEFYDSLTNDESGNMEYIIIPVLFDYTMSQEIKSNSIIV